MNLSAVNRFIGTEWKYGTNDCLAVFRNASLAVFGISVPPIAIPELSDEQANAILFDEHAGRSEWRRIDEPTPGCAALFRDRSGRAVHIGLYVVDDNVLHCHGSPAKPGRTAYDPLRLLRRVFGTVEFYHYVPHNGR